jgi:membrane protease YdiL (CAAX protease family)
MTVIILVSKAIIEQPSYPPTAQQPLGWCFFLSMEVATNTVVIGLAEEVFFRGLLYQALRQRAPAETAALISAILFTALHVHYLADLMRMVSVFLIGIVAAFFFERTHSLSTCIAFHLSANATVVANYYLTYFMAK